VHRTLAEKLTQNRVYECAACGERQSSGGWLLIDTEDLANCPSCGTYRLTLRRTPDKIDRMYSSPSNFFKRIFGGDLYRCRYCRIQFYDRRPLCEDAVAAENSFSYQPGERKA
jgi:DNA-directed RNA polymerase subunit RPC12/RpoP